MLKKYAIESKPYIGVFSVATEDLTIIPNIDNNVFLEAMETDVIKTTIGGTRVLGSLMCANSNGALVPDITEESEIEPILDYLDVTMVPDQFNALGNNILINDYGALVHPNIHSETIKALKNNLNVDVERGTIAGVKMIGSVATVTNKGLICHPHTEEKEIKKMENLFDVPVMRTTANHGSAWIGTCLIANTKGAVIGDRTTPIEMGRIEEGLRYLE